MLRQRSFFSPRCLSLVSEIKRKGYTIRPEYLLRDQDRFPESDPHIVKLGSWIEYTPFYHQLLDYFDSRTSDWLELLVSKNPLPEWWAIFLTEKTPFEFTDDILVSENKASALGYALEQIDYVRVQVMEVLINDLGNDISIIGTEGEIIARIKKVKFTQPSEMELSRAEGSLKGLPLGVNDHTLFKRLSKLRGYKKVLGEAPHPSDMDVRRKEALHINCTNLCISMLHALTPMIKEKVALHDCQEFVAHFLSFESWNHFNGAEKCRGTGIAPPHVIATVIDGNPVFDDLRFYRGLPAACHDFGLSLVAERVNDIERGTFFYGGVFFRNRVNEKGYGIELKQLMYVYCNEEHLEKAEALIQSNNIKAGILEYSLTGVDTVKRIVEFNKRNGVIEDDHVFHNGWVYWRNISDYPSFHVERLSDIGNKTYPKISSRLDKACFVRDDHGSFWLATDWDRKPKYRLPGLTPELATQIEQKFFSSMNWLNCNLQ